MSTRRPFRTLSTGEAVDDVLRVWATTNAFVMKATEEDLNLLLAVEKAGKARRLFLQRIYGRMTRLRAKRETDDLRAVAKDG